MVLNPVTENFLFSVTTKKPQGLLHSTPKMKQKIKKPYRKKTVKRINFVFQAEFVRFLIVKRKPPAVPVVKLIA